MAERTVSVRLRAEIADFKRKLGEAKHEVKGVTDTTEQGGKRQSAAWNMAGAALAGVGVAAAVGVGAAIKKFADFDAQMSAVQAASHETADSMGLLREAALQAGADTAFSASEAAQGIEELSRAGLATEDILRGGLTGALDLAAAGALGVGRAAEVTATTLKQFNLNGGQASHVADVLAAGAGKAQGSVEDLSGALKYAGVPAGQLGLSLEETAGTLALFASNGVIGEQAGTSFRAMLMSLTAPSKIAQEAMEEYSVTLFDANGEFVGMAAAADQLKTKLGPLSEQERQAALGRIFGNESMSAALALYAAGADGVQEWTQAVDDSGYAADTAAARLDNLKGDVEQLGGSLETALIGSGSGANGVLRELTQTATGAVNVFNDLPTGVQQAGLGLGAVVSAAGLATGAIVTLVPRIDDAQTALAKMGKSGGLAYKSLGAMSSVLTGPWGLAIAGAAVGLGIFANRQYEAQKRVDELAATLDQQTGAITENTRALIANRLEEEGALKAAAALGISMDTVTDAALGNEAAMRQVLDVTNQVQREALESASSYDTMGFSFTGASLNADALEGALGSLTGEIDEAKDATQRKAEAIGKDAEATDIASEAVKRLGEQQSVTTTKVEAAEDALSKLIQSMDELNGVGLSAIEAQSGWEAAIDNATAALKKNGAGLDLTTEKGRANQAALNDMAKAGAELADSILRETGSEEQMRGSLAASREALYQTALRFMGSEEAARAYVDRVLSVPTSTQTKAYLDTQDALAKLADFNREIAALDGSTATVYARVKAGNVPTIAGTRVNFAYADGGIHRALGSLSANDDPLGLAAGGPLAFYPITPSTTH